MPTVSPTPLDVRELERLLLATDVAACLVSPRLLRRVIRADRRIVGIAPRVPHAKSYVLARETLLKIAGREELGLAPGRDLPDVVLLLARPDPEALAAQGRDEVLLRLWRLLFHARVHEALERRADEGKLSEAAVRHRIQRLGPTEFAAARAVLREENFLLPARDARTAYVEFAAVYLELRLFAPALLPHTFPGLSDYAAVDALLAEDVDAVELLARARLPGAPDPSAVRPDAVPPPPPPRDLAPPHRPSEVRYRELIAGADRARGRGNVVRAAIRRMRAASAAAPKTVRTARNAARAELSALVDRLRPALGLTADEAVAWRQTLPALLPAAARAAWPVEARLLYDLQKVCTDAERDLYAADLVEWVLSLGRRPVKRPLPEQREVILLSHLRSAAARLPSARLPEDERRRLAGLFQDALERREALLRQRFRPRLDAVLDAVGLVPRDLPERVGRAKLVEGLLDRVVEHGFLTMGDLRDALSGSQLKLPDLAGLRELLLGDRLIRANRRLAVALDGVYHGGAIYLRWLQRLSALAFGTRPGRFLMLYLALPFGGAYAGLVGTLEIISLAARYGFGIHHFDLLKGQHPPPRAAEDAAGADFDPSAAEDAAGAGFDPTVPLIVLVLGLFLAGLIHVPPFRRAVGNTFAFAYRALHVLFVGLPSSLLRWPPLRRLLDSRAFAALKHYVLKPALLAAAVASLTHLAGVRDEQTALTSLAVFLGGSLVFNSRLGRAAEEVVADALSAAWHRFGLEIVPGFVRSILDLFKRLTGAVDRALYAIDEWLRFRAGQGRRTFVAKAVFGLLWFAAAYLIRMNVVLWVEPTFNPVKHFPTVTVAAKLLLPLLPVINDALLPRLGKAAASAIASAVLLTVPGLAGFAMWELKENWRLYAANRARVLGPVPIGSHGETMRRLLRPGLHSGTLPKLYAKLRKAERRALRRGAAEAVHKQRAALHHVEEAVRHFLEREFLALVNASTFWRAAPLLLGEVELGSNRVRAELLCPGLDGGGVWVDLEEREGWLLAGVSGPGWLPRMAEGQRQALTTALAGLYKLAGADLVRQQIEALLPAGVTSYDVAEEGLIVWGGDDFAAEAVYPFDGAESVAARVTAGDFGQALPPLPTAALRFDRVEVPWAWWVRAWEDDRAGKAHPPLPVDGWRLLPS